jgi:hypothetical protein
VLASIELGGGACLCSLASETPVRHAGLNGFTLAALYASCDGAAASPGALSCSRARVRAMPGLVSSFLPDCSSLSQILALLIFDESNAFIWF